MSEDRKQYPYIGSSPDNPNGVKHGLGFETIEGAQVFCDCMNQLLEDFDDNPNNWWDKKFWKSKPAPWQVFKNDNLVIL